MSGHDVPDVLRRLGIEAKRVGREFVALCPSPEHEDQRPSWRIRNEPGSRRHGMHHCWPCGFGGTIEKLVMAVTGLSWREAQEWLGDPGKGADRPIGVMDVQVFGARHDGWATVFRLPEGVRVMPWEKWPGVARNYAASRGITEDQATRWGLGVGVGGRLDGRIVFPKRDARGVAVGYSARTYVGDRVRYREAEPWEGASPSAVFGEEHWPAEEDRRRVYVAEGAINALACERAGAGCVATTSGSQLHPMIGAKLSTFGEVVAVTDPDSAGEDLAATVRSILSRHGPVFLRAHLPAGEDAASISETDLREVLEHVR